MAKPDVSRETLSALLATEMPGPIHTVEELTGGNVGRTYGFLSGDEAFVIRFNWRGLGGFGKEQFIEHLLVETPCPSHSR